MSRGVMEEQIDEGSTNVEPKVIAEGRSGETSGGVSKGTFTKGLMDDDR